MANSFTQLIEDARAGSDTAATQLVETYQPHVMRAVRRKLASEIRSKFDSEDFAQAVWTSFFRHRAMMLSSGSPEQLIGLLATMARNKVIDEIRRRMCTQKYNVKRETSLDITQSDRDRRHRDRLGTPSQTLIAREKLEGFLAKLPPEHRQVVQLRLDGLSQEDIAQQVNISQRTIRRILKKILNEE